MSSREFASISQSLDLTRVVRSVDAFSHAVHTQAPLSFFYLDQAHELTGRVRSLEKRIITWDNHYVLTPGMVTISVEEFEELRRETQGIRMAAKQIHGYFNYQLPRILAEPPSPSPSQGSSSSSGSSLNLSYDSGQSTSAGYQSASSALISSQSSSGSGSGSFGWNTPPHGQGQGQGHGQGHGHGHGHYSPPPRANTPSPRSDVSDVSSTSICWSNLGAGVGVGVGVGPSGSVHRHYPPSEGGTSGGSVFSSGSAGLVRASPVPSLGQSSTSSSSSSRHYTPL